MATRRPRVVTARPSKNGCRTCRLRKVKCSEERPNCRKCTNTGRTCEGYPPGSSPPTVLEPTRAIVPSSLSLFGGLINSSSVNATERNAFDFFLANDIPALLQILPSTDLVQATIKLAHEEPTVFHAMAAAGSVTRLQYRFTHHTMARVIPSAKDKNALSQHCKATSLLQKYMSDAPASRESLELMVVCSLLLSHAELLKDNHLLALSHLKYGRTLIQHYEQQLGITTTLKQPFNLLEGDAIDLGQRSLTQPTEQQIDQNSLPSQFTSIEHARSVLDSIMIATENLLAEGVQSATSHLSETNLVNSMPPPVQFCIAHSLSRSRTFKLSSSHNARASSLTEAHIAWSLKFEEFEQTTNTRNCRRSALLKMRHFYSSYHPRSAKVVDELPSDEHGDTFAQALEWAEIYLDGPSSLALPKKPTIHLQPQRSFSIEYGILPALYLIALKCRSTYIRRRAAAVLGAAARQEGHQFSLWLSIFAESVITLEEERANSLSAKLSTSKLTMGQIPESARFLDVVVDDSSWPQEIRICCTRYRHEVDQALEVLEYKGPLMPLPLRLNLFKTTTLPFHC